ncbi:MAG: hypothetical protein ACMUIP_02770 [bacterium]
MKKGLFILVILIIFFMITLSPDPLAKELSYQEDYYKSFQQDKDYAHYEDLANYNAYLSWLYEQRRILDQNVRIYEMRYNKALEDLDKLDVEISRIEGIVKNVMEKFENKLR